MDCLLLDTLEGEPCSGFCSQHAGPSLVNSGCGVMCYAKELEQEVAQLEAEAQWDLAQEDTLDTLLSCDTGVPCRGYCHASYPDESADSDDPEHDEVGEQEGEGGNSCAIAANADAVATGRGALRVGAWRGCLKSPWCDREDRHRGLCNRKATIPGPASITGCNADTSTPPDTPLAAAALDDDPFGLQHHLMGDAADSHPAAAVAAAATSDQASAGHHSHNLKSMGSLGSDDTEVASALKTGPSDASCSDMRRAACAPLALLPLLDALDAPPEPFWALPDTECYTGGSPLDDADGMYDLQQQMQLQLEQQRHQQQQGSLALRQRAAKEEVLGVEASGSEDGTGLNSCDSSPQRPPLAAAPLLVASVAQKPLRACLLLLPPTSLAGMCSSTCPSRPKALALPVALQAEQVLVTPPQLSTPVAAVAPAPCCPLPAPEPASAAAMPALDVHLAAAAATPPAPPAAAEAAAAAQPVDASSGSPELGQCGSSEGGCGGRSLRPASARVPKRSLDAALEEAVAVPVKKKPAHKSASAPHGHCCTQCGTSTTPVWRAGPAGPKTLCNACGVRFMKIAKRKA